MIESLSMDFAEGEVKTFQMQGEYFELLECLYPVDVLLMQRDGAQLSSLKRAEASYFARPGRFETYTIYSPQAQTVRWLIGSGDAGTRKTAGDVSVIDTVTTAGAHYYANSGVALGTAVSLLCDAASVPSGQLIVRGVSMYVVTGAGGACNVEAALIAAPAAPVDMTAGAGRIVIAHAFAATGTATPAADKYADFRVSRKLPAGWSVYLAEKAGTLAGAKVANLEVQPA